MKIKRSIFKYLENTMSEPEILVLLGARQVGKSTLMEDLMRLSKEQGKNCRYFNLEFPEDLLFFSKPLEELFEELTKEQNTALFIDEFHYLKNASKIFKGIYDLKKNIKIIASGSSSLEVHTHLKESLAGRKHNFKIYPLLWEEWRQTKGSFNDFLVYGGLPGLVHKKSTDEKIDVLSEIAQAYIMKDVKGLIREENIRAFNHVLYYLAENQGQLIPVSNISREVRLTNPTIEHYLNILEQTYVVYGLHSFASKLSNELKKSKKYYFYDSGVRNLLVKDFSSLGERSDAGFLFESYVFLELHKRLKPNIELRFWRTKAGEEVDFVWIENRRPIPIEVKSTFSDSKPPKAILKFMKTYSSDYAVIFNKERSEDLVVDEYLVKIRRFDEIDSVFEYKG